MGLFSKVATVESRIVFRKETPCLVASFKTSNPPLVWQMDLEKFSSCILSIREKDACWEFGFILPHGVFTQVALFDEKFEAEEALKLIQTTLMKNARMQGKSRWWQKLLMILGVLFLLSLLASALSGEGVDAFSAIQGRQQILEKTKEMMEEKRLGIRDDIRSGVPLSADDVLVPRGN